MNKNEIKDRLLIFLARKRLNLFLSIFDKYRSRKYQIPDMTKVKINYKIAKSKMVILYRISPFNNGKSPIYPKNKLRLTRICLKSLTKAFEKVKIKIIFILDSCPSTYENLIKQLKIKDFEILKFEKAGNKGTWFIQLEIVKRLINNNQVFLAEDDYLYLPKSGEKIHKALQKFDFIGPCDHLNYYKKPMVNRSQVIEFYAKQHWRNSESSCLTFGTKAKLIQDNISVFKRCGTFDHPIWIEMARRGYKLFTPIPSLSTHMVKNALAPGIDWQKEWKKYR